jgi:hypothetical protein
MIRTDQDRPSVQYDDGADAWWIRASALGGCIRSLVATGRGVEPQPVPEWMQEKYNEGHDAEPVIEKLAMEKRELVPMDTHKGLHVSFTHGDQVVNVSGSVDNFAIHRGGVGVPNQIDEYKALGKSYVNAIERLGENPDWRDVLKVLPAPYSTQISVYMHGAAAVPVSSLRATTTGSNAGLSAVPQPCHCSASGVAGAVMKAPMPTDSAKVPDPLRPSVRCSGLPLT